jgi:hypothetical protein
MSSSGGNELYMADPRYMDGEPAAKIDTVVCQEEARVPVLPIFGFRSGAVFIGSPSAMSAEHADEDPTPLGKTKRD